MKKLVDVCQKFKRFERVSQSEMIDLYIKFLNGEIDEINMLLKTSEFLVLYGYKYREVNDLKDSFFGKLQYKVHKVKEDYRLVKVPESDSKSVFQKDYFGGSITKEHMSKIYDFRTGKEIVEEAIKEVLLSFRYVDKYIPFDQGKVDILTNKIYSLLDFSYLNVIDILSYLKVNIMYKCNDIEDNYKETILNIVENYSDHSRRKIKDYIL